jgi:hypothetical protein
MHYKNTLLKLNHSRVYKPHRQKLRKFLSEISFRAKKIKLRETEEHKSNPSSESQGNRL